MYDCSKIKRLTIMYVSEGPGKYAGERSKVLGPEESMAICEEANSRKISIEMLLKSRDPVQSVVINTVLPFPSPEAPEKPEGKMEAQKEAEPKAEQATAN